MTSTSSDKELVSAYAIKGSETAFRVLVSRHVDLVFATAMRQVGDAGMAEEIAQNVFIILARKSPRLGGIETLAGWLHRTTILECKTRIRAEIRRRKREEQVFEMTSLAPDGESTFASMVPLLDEALLNLRESDRLALVLRYMEDRSLRDVGTVLGVDEDAARKRVSRALDRVTEFFRCRGFVTGGAGAVALFAYGASAAPATLAMTAANAGLAAKGMAGGVGVFLFHLMALTKIQTAAICIAVATVPLAMQWRADARLSADMNGVDARIQSQNKALADATSEWNAFRSNLVDARADAANSQFQLTALNDIRRGKLPSPVYRWDDNSPLARVPKKLLHGVPIPVMTARRGELTKQIKEALQLSEAEADRTQSALNTLLSDFESAQSKNMKRVDLKPEDLSGNKPENVRSFELSKLSETQFNEIKKSFLDEIGKTLGDERSGVFLTSIENVVPLNPPDGMMSSAWAIINQDFRLSLSRIDSSNDDVQVRICSSTGMMSYGIKKDNLPASWRNQIADWLNSSPTAVQEGGQ